MTQPPCSPPSLWHRAWYAVAFVRDLDRRRPTAFTLLEQDLVLWWDGEGQGWRAFADVCPHRLVPLSEGRINAEGQLECPYHGWSFAGDGHCTTIPQAEASSATASPRSRCRSYATAVAQDLLFVFAGDPDEAAAVPLPLVEPLVQEPEGWLVQDTFRDLPMDALTVLENVLDVSHVNFTHHATVGRRQNAGPVDLEVLDFGSEGFRGFWKEGPRRGKLGSQATTFLAPGLMWHDLTAPGFARILTVVYATPIRRGECRLFARFPFRFASPWPGRLLRLRPRWLQHLGNHKVLEDDQVFLHWQERQLEARGGSEALARSCYLATSSDRYVQALHRWVLEHAGLPFPTMELGPRLGLRALMDREESHTRHCQACSGALTAIRRWRPVAPVLAWGALALIAWWRTPLALAIGLGLAALAALLHRQCDLWEQQLLQGDGHPPRNQS